MNINSDLKNNILKGSKRGGMIGSVIGIGISSFSLIGISFLTNYCTTPVVNGKYEEMNLDQCTKKIPEIMKGYVHHCGDIFIKFSIVCACSGLLVGARSGGRKCLKKSSI